jgi:predicted ester cyclase
MAEPAAQAQKLDRAWVEDFSGRLEAAWNSREHARLRELMTADIVFDDSGWPTTMRGHGDVRTFLDFLWRAFPDLRFERVEGPYIVPGQPKAAIYWTVSGTHTGPLDPPGFAPTGKPIEFEVVSLYEYREERVCRLRSVFDVMDLGRQIGTVPKAGSPVEKAAAAAQRLGMTVRKRLQR